MNDDEIYNLTGLDWRKDYLDTKRRLSTLERELLEKGPTSWGGAMLLGEMKRRWLKMKGLYKATPPPPDVSSNLKDSLKRWRDE